MRKRRSGLNAKERRHSGRVVAKIYDPVAVPLEWTYWDDWIDYRDSMRDRPWRLEEQKKEELRKKREKLLRKKRLKSPRRDV